MAPLLRCVVIAFFGRDCALGDTDFAHTLHATMARFNSMTSQVTASDASGSVRSKCARLCWFEILCGWSLVQSLLRAWVAPHGFCTVEVRAMYTY